MKDVRAAKMCSRGCRDFCEKHGIEWSEVIKSGGVDSEVLLATGDAMATRLVEVASGRQQ